MECVFFSSSTKELLMYNLSKAILLTAGLIAGSAQALVIDFTDADQWSVSGHTKTVSYDDLDVTLTAYGSKGYGTLTSTPYNGNNCGSYGGAGLDCETDGIGIDDDEVTANNEYLSVDFSHAVNISSITLLDLFAKEQSDPYPEEALVISYYASGDHNLGIWEGTALDDRTGFLTATIGNAKQLSSPHIFTGVSSVTFGASSYFNNPVFSDFSLAAIELASPVSEPGSAVLLGVGLLSLVRLRRRRRA
ncbi:MAG: PEP-CTERM sorting domain-containing protein [Reinekea sp.]